MADTSPAEIMLDSLVPAQRLIRRLQDILKAPLPYVGTNPPPAIKAKIAAFQDSVQRRIDELTAQREEAMGLIQQIPDQTARTIIELRYVDAMPYPDVCDTLAYENKTIFRYRKKGVDHLNQILERRKGGKKSC